MTSKIEDYLRYGRQAQKWKTTSKMEDDFKMEDDQKNGRLPQKFEELKKLPGIGDYTASAISAIAFNRQLIPLDGNIERLLKRILNLKTDSDIKKENLHKKKKIFGVSSRSSDYVQALMEIGSLLCKPKNPHCEKCPITKNCLSFKNKNFVIKKKNKKIINKFYLATLYRNNDQVLLIRNDRFKFLKNLLIFPMKEVSQLDSSFRAKKKLNLKMSNMNMNIYIDFSKTKKKLKNGLWIEQKKLQNYMIPTFTKKIFDLAKHNL